MQSGGFLGRFLRSLIQPGLPLIIKNVVKPLAKRVSEFQLFIKKCLYWV